MSIERQLSAFGLIAASLIAAGCAAPTPRTGDLGLGELPATGATTVVASPGDSPRQDEAPAGQAWRGGFHGLIGYRALDEDTWSSSGTATDISLDQQFALGLELDFRPPEFPLGVEFGMQFSAMTDSVTVNVSGTPVDVDFTGSVYEFYLGPRLTFDLADDKIHPYVGAGLTYLFAEIEAEASAGGVTVAATEDEDSLAGYVHAGLLFDLGESFHLGADVRAVMGSDLGSGADADYIQGALVIGTSW
jgi:hypothetical protein